MIISVQADNTSREVKNNHYIRFLASLVSHGILSLRIKHVFYFLHKPNAKRIACYFCDEKVFLHDFSKFKEIVVSLKPETFFFHLRSDSWCPAETSQIRAFT